MRPPDAGRYRLVRTRVPAVLVDGAPDTARRDRDDLLHLDLAIADGHVAGLYPAGSSDPALGPAIDLDGGQVWPCFVDMHTHLDKGHIWPRAANPDGSFMGALNTVRADRDANWEEADVRRRMDFALRCALAHGTRAIRTHLDSAPPRGLSNWAVFKAMKREWAGRIELQGVALMPVDTYAEHAYIERLADAVADAGGMLGGATHFSVTGNPVPLIDRAAAVARDRGLGLDFHVDETLDPSILTIEPVARAVMREKISGPVVCGHCCVLSVQPEPVLDRVLGLARDANLAVVSLPMCNMYLQDRGPAGRTPRRRGTTALHELKRAGIPLALASDNTRDPFYAYGDLDMLEVFQQAVRIGQLDHPIGEWPAAVTRIPADLMGLPQAGRIAAGLPADLVLFRGRAYSELLSRRQAERVVLHRGRAIDAVPPDYRELDDLFGRTPP
ncbi:MAG: cytosine deaminase [Alphaproteobacteria bacterium]|nr:cytosine deaminase [Alphaproteobacteria bacterium]